MGGKFEKYPLIWEYMDHSDPVSSVCLDPVSMHICLKYEGSVMNYTGKRANYIEKEKWLPFKKSRSY